MRQSRVRPTARSREGTKPSDLVAGQDKGDVAEHKAVRRVARGASFLTAASVVVGLANYGYSLVLLRLLDPDDFASFAAAQGVVLVCGTVATASMPWVVAQAFARSADAGERRQAVWFSVLANVLQGLLGAVVVVAVTVTFLDGAELAWAAVAAFSVFLVTSPAGAAQGTQRFGVLAALRLGEVILKIGLGIWLVSAGAGVAGAMASAAVGAIVIAGVGAYVVRYYVRPMPLSSGLSRLWRASIGVAGVQGLVALLASLDIILVGLLVEDDVAAGSYQAAAILGRVPMFVSSALSAAAFVTLARRGSSAGIVMANVLRTYTVVATLIVAVLATAPDEVLALVFPPEYALASDLLPFTAATGAAAGAVNVITTWYQAAGRYRPSITIQVAGTAVAAVALVLSAELGGIREIAHAAPLGAAACALALFLFGRSQWSAAVLRPIDALGLVALAACCWSALVWPHLWYLVTPLFGAMAAHRLLRGPSRRTGHQLPDDHRDDHQEFAR